MGVVTDYIEAAVLFAAGMSLLFVATYTWVAPWWRHETGRSIVAFDTAVLLALLPSALHYLLGLNVRHAFFAWYDGSSLMAAGVITAWRIAVLLRVQRDRGRKPPDSDQPIT